jgi:phage gp36-like protein
MSSSLKIENYTTLNTKERSSIKTDNVLDATTIELVNNNNIVTGDPILIGTPGENAEIRTVISITGVNIVTVAALKHVHQAYEPIQVLRGDKLRIYRANNVNGLQPADTSFGLLTTIDIDPDQKETEFIDPDGSADYWYKFTYYNEALNAQTSLAESGSARGGGSGQYCSLDSIRKAAGFEHNQNLTDTLIAQFRTDAQDYINGALTGLYVVPLVAPINAHIAHLTRSLAANYLKEDQYGLTPDIDTAIKQLKKDIEAIKSGQVQLVDVTGVTQPVNTDMGFSGYPNDVTDADGFNGAMFTRASIEGYHSRKY